jgi:aspartate racemase
LKTIGLIGGMSWESTAHYYRALNEETARRLGALHSAPILLQSLDFAPIEELQRTHKWDEAGAVLTASAKRLESAGAGVIGLATNTMHIVADQIMNGIGVPFLHIADPTAEALKARRFRTVGLLGTRFTMEMSFYKDRLKAQGLEVLVPDEEVPALNAIIYDELCRGIVRDESHQIFIRAIERLAQRGAQAVILGCTEIGMLIDGGSSPLPVFDTTDLHAKALVAAALADETLVSEMKR